LQSIIIIDPQDHTIFDVNPIAAKMIGADKESIVGSKCHRFICPKAEKDCPITDHGQSIDNSERVLLTAQGQEVPVLKTVVPVVLGGKDYLLESVVDITERKAAEEALSESQGRLDMAMSASNTGLWDWRPQTGEDYHNEQWFRQLGYSSEDFGPDSDPLMELMHPEDADKFKENMALYLASGEDDSYKQEFRMKAKDGGWRWILSLGEVSERDEAGKATRVIGVHLDMTERRDAELKLAESEKRLGLALEGGNLGIWDVDFEVQRTVVDKGWASIMGVELNDDLNPFQLWIDSIHPDDYQRVRQAGKDYREGRLDEYEVTYRARVSDGQTRWQVSRGKAVKRDKKGQVSRMVGTVMDITERMEAEEELRRNLEELERFSRLVVGREEMMISLKEEINQLLLATGKSEKYKIVH